MEELEWHTKSQDSKVELAEFFNAYSLCHASSGIDPASLSSPTAFEFLKKKTVGDVILVHRSGNGLFLIDLSHGCLLLMLSHTYQSKNECLILTAKRYVK